MHASVLGWVPEALTVDEVTGKRVIEIGSYNYNGSARPYIESLGPVSYLGTDAQPGTGVDLAVPAERLPGELGRDSADIVASFEMLEHAEDWRGAVAGMARLLAPGGLLLLTTRSPGFPYHPHPGDFWRFTLDDMAGIALACGLDVLRLEPDPDPGAPGVFLLARKPGGWDGTGMAEGLGVVGPRPAASEPGWHG